MKKKKFSPIKMVQDLEVDKFTPDLYYSALNMRVNASESNTFGGRSNDRGNELSISIPNIFIDPTKSKIYLSYDNAAPAGIPTNIYKQIAFTNDEIQATGNSINHYIIGSATYLDYIILCTTPSINYSSSNQGAIWKFTPKTGDITLLYYNRLGFSVTYPIREALASYETSDIIRFYFTDFNNYFRALDIGKADCLNFPLSNLNAVPFADLQSVNVLSMQSGGTFKNGKVGYVYQLYNENGTITAPSTMPALYNINRMYIGGTFEENVGISVKLEVPAIDARFKFIRLYRVFYSSKDVLPTISLIADQAVIGGAAFNYTDIGNLSIRDVSLPELYESVYTNFQAKTMVVKDGHMFLGNIKTKAYNPTWDARTYRFDNTSNCRLYDSNNSTIAFSYTDLISGAFVVPTKHDCGNLSNYVETNRNPSQAGNYYGGIENANYKKYYYQGNGSTVGGQGLNIRYRFITESFSPVTYQSILFGFNFTDESYAHPGASAKAGYKRDEIYRFGIRLTNTEGIKSPVYWIGDIRFPTTDMVGFEITEDEPGSGGVITKLKRLGIRFEVNNLPTDCASWEIVRVERTDADKTIIAQGFVQPMTYQVRASSLGEDTTAPMTYYEQTIQPSIYLRTLHTLAPTLNITDSMSHGKVISKLRDNPTIIDPSPATVNNILQYSYMAQFYSPEIEHKGLNFDGYQGGYFKSVGGAALFSKNNPMLRPRATRYWAEDGEAVDSETEVFKTLDNKPEPLGEDVIDANISEIAFGVAYTDAFQKINTNVGKASVIRIAPDYIKFVPESWNGSDNDFATKYVFGTSPANSSNSFVDKCLWFHRAIIGIDYFPVFSFQSVVGYYKSDVSNNLTVLLAERLENHFCPAANLPESVFAKNEDPKIPVVDLKRNLNGLQYLGYTYEARSSNVYLSASPTILAGTSTVDVFAGDTYVCYYNHTRLTAKYEEQFKLLGTIKQDVILPIETSVNTDLRTDNYKAKYSEINTKFNTIFEYNDVFSQENNVFPSMALPFDFVEDVHQFYRIKGSNPKIYGEKIDSWLKYEADKVLDLTALYGPINKMLLFQNEVYGIQDSAVSLIRIFPREMVQSKSGENLQLGFGGVLNDFMYLTTTTGSSLQYAVVVTNGAIYYVDTFNKKVYRVIPGKEFGPLSDTTMLTSFIRANVKWNEVALDNPYLGKGILLGNSDEYKDVYMSVFNPPLTDERVPGAEDDYWTLTFNEDTQAYMTFHSFTPPHYIQHQGQLYSVKGKELWKHFSSTYTKYYGVQEPMRITLLVYPEERNYSSIYEVLGFTAKVINAQGVDFPREGITRIRAYNEYQDSGWINADYLVNSKRIFREWKLHIPRQNRNKMRGTYTFIELEYAGDGTKQITINDLILSYQLFPGAY